MKIKALLFATLKEKTGQSRITLNMTEPATVADMLDAFFQQFPALKPSAKNILVSVNQEFAEPSEILHTEDEIALFPPVSGG